MTLYSYIAGPGEFRRLSEAVEAAKLRVPIAAEFPLADAAGAHLRLELPPVSNRSRDRLPNPVSGEGNPYVPVNTPAIGDLFDLFDFGRDR